MSGILEYTYICSYYVELSTLFVRFWYGIWHGSFITGSA